MSPVLECYNYKVTQLILEQEFAITKLQYEYKSQSNKPKFHPARSHPRVNLFDIWYCVRNRILWREAIFWYLI